VVTGLRASTRGLWPLLSMTTFFGLAPKFVILSSPRSGRVEGRTNA
jgi:hypothetical protein